MPRGEQTVAYGTETVLPSTVRRIPRFATTGIPAKITNSDAFAEGDVGNQVIIGLNAFVNAGQTAGTAAVVMGKAAQGWGADSVSIGTNASAGQAAKVDGHITIGGNSPTGKNGVRIGSALAFGGAFSDYVSLGTQTQNGGQNAVSIGTAAGAQAESVAIGDTASGGEPWAVAIGYHATCSNSGNGTGSKCIAIGYQASAIVTSPGDQSAIAIGRDALCSGRDGIAIGRGASVSPSSVLDSIALGHGATSAVSNEFVVGDTTNGPVNRVRVKTAAANPLRHIVGATGALIIQALDLATDLFTIDTDAGAGNIRMLVYDVTAGALKRVSRGGDGVAPVAGFRCLQIPA